MMKRLLPALVLVLAAFGGQTMQVDNHAPVAAAEVLTADHEFIGAARCKTCHNKEADGAQYDKWAASKHSKAYATLGSEAAKKIAAEKGIADPQKAAECLQCHVAGHGVKAELLGSRYSVEDGVSCEACHGPGGDYYKKATMEAVTAGEVEAASVGLLEVTKETCLGCHNDKSPTFKEFNYEKSLAKIAHPKPKG